MKLECKIKRDGGTVIDMPNGEGQKPTRVHFKPLDPRDPDSPHVADVSAAHAKRFFKADAEVYQLYDAAPAPSFAPPAPPVPPAPPAPPADAQTPPQQGAAGDPNSSAGAADTNNDGHLTVAELTAGIEAGRFSAEQLRELMEAEQQSESPRKSFVDAIVKALK